MTSKKQSTAEQALEEWFEEVGPALKASSNVKAATVGAPAEPAKPATPANRSAEARPVPRDQTSEQTIEQWFDEVARDRPARKLAPEVAPRVSVSERGIATSLPRRDPGAEQAPERWFEGIVDRWFGEVDGSFRDLEGPISADRRQVPSAEPPRASRPSAAQHVTADVVARTAAEPPVVPGLSRASAEPYVAPTFSRASDDPASTVAQYHGKLEGFNNDLRLLGPRIRRADLLLRIFNRREPALTS